MYSEKTFKNYIFWIQVKRVVLIILLSCIGAGIGIGIGSILSGTLNITNYNNIIIIVSTIIFFLLSLIITAGTGKEVQDGYWKIAVLRKLTVIQKDLEGIQSPVENSKVQIEEIKEKEILKPKLETKVKPVSKNKRAIKKPELAK